MKTRTNVQVYLWLEDQKQVLFLRRTPSRSGKWQPVCGGQETGEALETTARREVLEETKVKLGQGLEKLPLVFHYQTDKNGEDYRMTDYVYLAPLKEKPLIGLSQEHDHYLWLSLNEARDLTTWEPIHQVFDYLEGRM